MPTRTPGFGAGNRLVTRFGRVDDMDNDTAYRIGPNNANKKRFPAAGPAETMSLTNATIQEFSTAPAIGEKEAGYEVQNNGNVFSVVSEDNGAGPPTFNALNSITDWIDNKSYVGTYHARMNKTGGAGSLGPSSSPENVWREIGVDSALWLLQSGNGAGFVDWQGLIEVSDDGGSTTGASATITLETNEV